MTIDLGEPENVHPPDKVDVGKRLGLAASGSVYGEQIPWSGPLYEGADEGANAVRIRFRNIFGGMRTSDGGPLSGFAIAGDDHRFAWAQARIDADSVVVSNSSVVHPKAVRYDWADTPDGI